MPPVPATGDRLRRSYYRTLFCEILDPPQSTYIQIGDVLSRSVGQMVLFTLKAALSVAGRSAEGIINSRKMASSRSRLKPFVTKFHGKTQLTSTEFMEVFRKYDKDGKLCLN